MLCNGPYTAQTDDVMMNTRHSSLGVNSRIILACQTRFHAVTPLRVAAAAAPARQQYLFHHLLQSHLRQLLQRTQRFSKLCLALQPVALQRLFETLFFAHKMVFIYVLVCRAQHALRK